MYKFIKIIQDNLIQCQQNPMEMKKNDLYAWDWHFKKFLTKILKVLLKGLGVQKDTQTPCWLRQWRDQLPYSHIRPRELPSASKIIAWLHFNQCRTWDIKDWSLKYIYVPIDCKQGTCIFIVDPMVTLPDLLATSPCYINSYQFQVKCRI